MNPKPETPDPELQLFLGDANEAIARVYATLPRDGLPDDAQLIGELVGPQCRHSQTLPARIRFTDRGPGSTLLAEAVVPDPCFWSPDLPFMYSAKLRVMTSDSSTAIEPLKSAVQPVGIRRLGVHGTSLFLNAKRFVLRGVRVVTGELADLATAKQGATALFVSDPSDEFLREASEEGVLFAVELQTNQLNAELTRLGRWPAVAVVVLDSDFPAGKELRLAARNILLAQRATSTDAIKDPAPWAHLLWWQVDADDVPTAAPSHEVPIINYRPTSKNATIEESRRACDRLQADLAPLGDFAGYFT